MNLIPTYEHIILEQIEAETKTESGILLSGARTNSGVRAKVVAAGNGRLLQDGTLCKLAVSKGDTVVLGLHSECQEETIGGTRYLITRESSVVAIETPTQNT